MQESSIIKAIDVFSQKGEGYKAFAILAAQPLLFSTDLLYKLWLNFRVNIDAKPENQPSYLVVSDLILSSLCEPIGSDLFRMINPVRNHLFKELKTLKVELNDIALFVQEYAFYNKANLSNNIFEIHRIWSLGMLNPQKMEQEIIDNLSDSKTDYDKINQLSLYFNVIGPSAQNEGKTGENTRISLE